LIAVTLNGKPASSIDPDRFVAPNKRPDGSEHRCDIACRDHPGTGSVGLQHHRSLCGFKNIKLRPLHAN